MSTLHTCGFVVISAFVAACGGGDGDNNPDALIVLPDGPPDAPPPPPPDAQEFDFSCMSNPAPDMAPATITLSGTAQDFDIVSMSLEPVPAAAVIASNAQDQPLGAPSVSDDNGDWTLSNLPTQGMPLDGYIEAAKAEHRTTRLYPPQPLTADQAMIPLLVLANSTFNLLAGSQQTPGNGTIFLVVMDCAGTPIGGATISAKQDNAEVGQQQELVQLQPGLWVVFNVPPGNTIVDASVQGMSFREHTVGIAAETSSFTVVNPGFIN